MNPRISESERGLTVYIDGELDHHNARELREYVDAMIQQKKPSLLRLDFSKVGFMDSSGIGFVMGRYRMISLYGGELRIINLPSELERIMKLSGLGALNVMERRGEVYEEAQ